MGGYGSTRWAWHTPKDTVEDSLTLSMPSLLRAGFFKGLGYDGNYESGSILWKNAYSDKVTSSVSYSLSGVYLHLNFTVTIRGEKRSISQTIELQYTVPNFGGKRWWFTCPLCRRRVGKLHVPPSGIYFWCRHCYDLTYKSCQESHKYDRMFSMIAAETGMPGMTGKRVEEMLKESFGDW